MGDEPILPVIQPVTINTVLNNNWPNIGDGLNFATLPDKGMFKPCSHLTSRFASNFQEWVAWQQMMVFILELLDLTAKIKEKRKRKV